MRGACWVQKLSTSGSGWSEKAPGRRERTLTKGSEDIKDTGKEIGSKGGSGARKGRKEGSVTILEQHSYHNNMKDNIASPRTRIPLLSVYKIGRNIFRYTVILVTFHLLLK